MNVSVLGLKGGSLEKLDCLKKMGSILTNTLISVHINMIMRETG